VAFVEKYVINRKQEE